MKDHFRSAVHGLPNEFYTKLMVRSLIFNVCRLLNTFPSVSGVSFTLSPLSIVHGTPPPSYQDFDLTFGAYVQVHDNLAITNTAVSRTTGAIALRPYNDNGGWAFMSLSTGDQVIRSKQTQFPTPSDVIARVHELAVTQSQTKLNVDTSFTWSSGDFIHVVDEGAVDANDFLSEPENNNANENDEPNNAGNDDQNEDEDNNNFNNFNNDLGRHDNINDITDDEDDKEETEAVNEEAKDHHIEEANDEEIYNELENRSEESVSELEKRNEQSNEEQRSEEFNSIFDSNMKEVPKEEEDSGTKDDVEDDFNLVMKEVADAPDENEIKREDNIGKEKLRYNLRKKIRQAKDQNFNKNHYNFLNVYKNKTMRY